MFAEHHDPPTEHFELDFVDMAQVRNFDSTVHGQEDPAAPSEQCSGQKATF
jgi:hypothetical protein